MNSTPLRVKVTRLSRRYFRKIVSICEYFRENLHFLQCGSISLSYFSTVLHRHRIILTETKRVLPNSLCFSKAGFKSVQQIQLVLHSLLHSFMSSFIRCMCFRNFVEIFSCLTLLQLVVNRILVYLLFTFAKRVFVGPLKIEGIACLL